MAYQDLPKMSLVAQYDDLCRSSQVLTSGPEEEFKVFVENQLRCARNWKNSEFEVNRLHQKMSKLELENGRLNTTIKHLKDLLKNADSTNKRIEKEKHSLSQQISIIKKILLEDGVMENQTKEKLNLLSLTCKQLSQSRHQTIEASAGSLLSLSDIDQTDEDLERGRRSSKSKGRKSKGKRSSSETTVSIKKKKIDEAEQFINRINEDDNIPFINSDQPSNSDPASSSPDNPVISKEDHNLVASQFRFNAYDAKCADSSLISQYSVTKHLSKDHQFVSKIVMNRRVKCLSCNKNIGYLKQSLKCQVCGIIICHQECIPQCPICFPIVNIPTKGSAGTIADYTSSTSPMIPPLIVHCIKEIESRGMKELGLYRIPAANVQVKSLKEKFVISRTIPRLKDIDIHVLCGAVKHFLRSLKEPLITQNAWHKFVQAADLQDDTESCYALLGFLTDLPQPNRDTLAFLMLHLQMIAESPAVKMTIDNLATELGPAIVGYSMTGSADADMLTERKCQKKVMKRLLYISSESWHGLLSSVSEIVQGGIKATPENLPAPKQTRLGPIYSVQENRNLRKTRATLRNPIYNKGARNLASPLLR